MLFDKYGTGIGRELKNSLLTKDPDSFNILSQIYNQTLIRERSFSEIYAFFLSNLILKETLSASASKTL